MIVNETFVKEVLGGGNALGRRLRFREGVAREESPGAQRWYEVIGVVRDVLQRPLRPDDPMIKIYRPLIPGQFRRASLALRVPRTAQPTVVSRIRKASASLDASLQVDNILPLDSVWRTRRRSTLVIGLLMGLFSLSILAVSVAGTHTLLSVMVTARWREIAIRSALGAEPRHTLRIICSRALGQLAIGCALGIVAAFQIDRYLSGDLMYGYAPSLMFASSLLMMAVGLLAVAGPVRRGLMRQPMDALRED